MDHIISISLLSKALYSHLTFTLHTPTAVSTMQGNNQHIRSS